MNSYEQQKQRFDRCEAVAGVIGLGYVGLPLVMQFTQAGYKTIGFDIDPIKVRKLLAGESYIGHIPGKNIENLVQSGMFDATTDFSRLSEVDAVAICVPTPLDEHMQPDLSYVEKTAQAISPNMKKAQLVILESTTYPGTTEELVRPVLEEGGRRIGEDFFLAFSPEREDPGNKKFNTGNIPKVIGASTSEGLELMTSFYGKVFNRTVPVSSTQAAEMTKLLENIFRCVNIALVNELKILCDRMDLDIWEVIEAASTKPFGFMPFFPGPGLGGHCIPIDPFYLSWKAHEFDFHTRFIELAGEVNTRMPYYVVEKVIEALNESGQSIKGAKALILGVAYKKDIDDCRESPAFKVISLLRDRGAEVSYTDPHVPVYPAGRKGDPGLQSVALSEEYLASIDVVIVITDHTAFDYEWIVNNSSLIIDTRNATKRVAEGREKIVKA